MRKDKNQTPLKFSMGFTFKHVLITTMMLLLAGACGHTQPDHQRLLFQHPLTSEHSSDFANLSHTEGLFVEAGWQARSQESQLTLTFSNPLPDEGTIRIDVTQFDPVSQNVPDLKQHIINLYSRIYENNKDVFDTNGAWWNIRTGTFYSTGPGKAGFKFLCAPKGIDTRREIRCIEDATWNLDRTYEFKVTWTTSHIYCSLDNELMASFPFNGQVEPFRYMLIGQDNLIWGYCAQPGPIYSNLRIHTTGEPVQDDRMAPRVKFIALPKATRPVLFFDEPVQSAGSTDPSSYQISSDIAVKKATLSPNQTEIQLETDFHLKEKTYTLELGGISDLAEPSNTLSDTSITYTYTNELQVSQLSRAGYTVQRLKTGDKVYMDREYTLNTLPEQLKETNWIITANDDKYSTQSDFLSFAVNHPITVFVSIDERLSPIPDWLTDWKKIDGIQVTTDSGTYHCYEKKFPPGIITLGGNNGQQSSNMYLIALRSEEDRTSPDPPEGVHIE